MPKFKELREAKGLQAKQVAETASVDVTMYSRFENYRALPIPCDFERILEALECLPSDVYTPNEVRLLPNATKVEATGGARADRKPTEYKMTVRLDNNSRQVLTREILQKCGYKSINDFIIACVLRLKIQYEAIISQEKKPRNALRNKANGAAGTKQTTNIPTDTILSKSNSFVKQEANQMKIYRSYENGYKEQQAKVTALTKTLINEAINARIANGQITADDFEIYALVSSYATEQLEAAQKEFADEQAKDKGVSE